MNFEQRVERLEKSRLGSPFVAIAKRFLEIEGFTQGALLSIELFTTVIPLMIIGFGLFRGLASNANVGTMFIKQLGLESPLSDRVQAAFGSAQDLGSTMSVAGLGGFLIWGIPMSITVATMFARAWRREPFPMVVQLARGALWFVLYLALMMLRQRIAFGGQVGGFLRTVRVVVSLIPVWCFWWMSPTLLVRDGGRGRAFLMRAGLVGVLIDGLLLPISARLFFPMLLSGWDGFGSIGVAMTLMTWCGITGIGWVVTACAGAISWERNAPIDTVIESQTAVDLAES